MKKSNFSELKGWKDDDFYLFDKALKSVCSVIVKNPRQSLNSDRLSYSLLAYKNHCQKMVMITDKNALKRYIESNFEPYAVVVNGQTAGKFTSYYEANIRASYEKGGVYQYPIYGKPKDLVEVNLKDFDASLPNQRLVGRVKNGKLVKYYTRTEIDNGQLDAPVILWGDDPVDIYIMQIQGAAVATLPNGQEVRVGYAENNGHKFRGIGSVLLEKKLIKPSEASMPKIRAWLKNNGDTAKKNMLLNDRFIFHQIVKADGPIGAMGLPLYAGRALAVDRAYIPLGSMMWMETTAPDGLPLNRAVMAEDVGSAIQGGIRGDYFWGHGEKALEQAGRMNASGRYYILLPKGTEVSVYGR
ncbi:murein transglycosylase A [bacterium]|nr:murein transglycosylase A [bacterium]MBR2273726.1 murein transglycosylase A [Alphaproteobacteria bacterium]